MEARLIDSMGTDLTVVNAARVSFHKESHWEEVPYRNGWDQTDIGYEQHLSEKDQKLIKYLAFHNHWTPFSHVMITMQEKVPIFVARQRFKHMIGFTYNEVSRRYVDDAPEFFTPDVWRAAPEDNKKQGSSDKEFLMPIWAKLYRGKELDAITDKLGYEDILELCETWYRKAVRLGMAPEQARMILPQSMYTEYYVTGSLAAWARAYKLRIDPHAQKEIQDLAVMWGEIIGNMKGLEYSWQALTQS